ncbi:hypothetical protein [Pseudogemmobacter sp. W21_MBD1_M6]|uniref:hypothetical protein n=1 Tax=Pseudogemmobacter sp. W21_MBD1_M6 TaxID=3240271 RepID=UPI003F987A0A
MNGNDVAAGTGTTTPTAPATGLDLPPGTIAPTPSSAIERYEAKDGNGNGYAQSVSYDAVSDRFLVDNLAFDGENAYPETTTALVQTLASPFKVYENEQTVVDDVNGQPITQFVNRAIYGKSTSGSVEFAIVRTGSYVGYGFGGFVYRRADNSGVTLPLPTTGQAKFTGNYAAVRDFNGRSDLEYATGDVNIDIDLADFNEGDGVKGYVTNRKVYDLAGNDITASIIIGIETNPVSGGGIEDSELRAAGGNIPTLVFRVGPGVLDTNGELAGNIDSSIFSLNGGTQTFETGKYYGILSGAAPDELVGVIVVEGADLRYSGVTVRETGGFIAYRQPTP